MNGEMESSAKDQEWVKDDLLKLLDGMKANLPQNDISKYKTAESHLDWEKVRKFRTLSELIVDAQDYIKNPYKGKNLKKHPDFPKKPLTPYFRFFMEKRAKYAKLHPEMSNLDLTKILSKKYRELPERKKAKYMQDFQREKELFEQNMGKFREEHPDLIENMKNMKRSDVPEKPKTPQQLWYNHEKKAVLKAHPEATTKDIKETLAKQWTQLSDKKRLKWINKSLEQQKQYEEAMREFIAQHPELNMSQEDINKSTLTKAERQLKDKFDGRPTKPPPNGYSMFCAELMSTMKDVPSTERMVMCSQQWKLLKQSEKDGYQKRCEQKKKEYEIEMNRFLCTLSEEEQQRVLGEDKMLGFNKKGSSSPSSKKNSKTKSDSSKPKRPISAMFIFSEEKRPKLQQDRPELSESELTRMLARMWNELSDKKKEKYKRLEAALKAESEKKGQEERSRLPEELSEMRSPAAVVAPGKKMKFDGEPKKPPSNGYQKFSQELLSGGELNHLPMKERMGEIGGRWQRLPQREKDRYKRIAEEKQKQYKVQLDQWLKTLSSHERAMYTEYNTNKRKSTGKPGGTNAKVKAASSRKSNEDDDDDDEDEEAEDKENKTGSSSSGSTSEDTSDSDSD
ncbi:nucleolar transcription factor 1-like [Scleropages formosus]|uniref:Nucleolar transcription factor 1-like n=1 Tax=Scleropages formosus TaxID=113540 RepID=A0A0P7YUC3_SCLFO|nr:nucleolar transcription factor 1-like [Scleropages formosus]